MEATVMWLGTIISKIQHFFCVEDSESHPSYIILYHLLITISSLSTATEYAYKKYLLNEELSTSHIPKAI